MAKAIASSSASSSAAISSHFSIRPRVMPKNVRIHPFLGAVAARMIATTFPLRLSGPAMVSLLKFFAGAGKRGR